MSSRIKQRIERDLERGMKKAEEAAFAIQLAHELDIDVAKDEARFEKALARFDEIKAAKERIEES